MSAPPIAEQLAELGLMVGEARAEVAAGQPVDLVPFSTRLGEICAQIEAAPSGEAERHGPALLKLRDELECLARDLMERMKELAGQVGEGLGQGDPAAAPGKPPPSQP